MRFLLAPRLGLLVSLVVGAVAHAQDAVPEDAPKGAAGVEGASPQAPAATGMALGRLLRGVAARLRPATG